ncbi:PilZ domain-containing protein [Phenylobacterium sp.]|uniref:PilZ domain-containing protein n=1 Tax=Phenylobacterium sp. TaxID=1871053 RepID=UPI003BACB198
MNAALGNADHRRRRVDARHRCLLTCKIVFGTDDLTVDGVLRDRSTVGARLRIVSPLALPKQFRVVLAKEGECFEAQLIWRRGVELGVRLLSPIDIAAPTDISVRQLRRIWIEMAARDG